MAVEKPLVSIMVPVYNNSETLGRCLKSVLEQDYDNLLVSAWDNHSNDESFDIMIDFERQYRDRLYIGRGHTRLTTNQHHHKCGSLNNPRCRYIEFVYPTDVLKKDHVTRCAGVMEANHKIGCVLSHADIIHPMGKIESAPSYLPGDCVIPAEIQMNNFMAHGFEINTFEFFRIEAYRLWSSEGLVFNKFPSWLPLASASSIWDFGYINSVLAFRGDLKAIQGDDFIATHEELFEHYLFLQAFKNIAIRLQREKVCDNFPKALFRLSLECVRCASVLAEADEQQQARSYLSLAMAYLPEITDTDDFRRLVGIFKECAPNSI